MTIFRPCIDIHEGKVKQIVGSTLKDSGEGLTTNFISDKPASWFAELYRQDGLRGGHIIMLGTGNDTSAQEALKAYPDGLQVGGGIRPDNALLYLEWGASHVIVTSWIFPNGILDRVRLQELSSLVGKDRLVLDLSCRRKGNGWAVAINRWQTLTDVEISASLIGELEEFCDEFLIHAADVEGKCRGIDEELVSFLASTASLPTTYAGGASTIEDLRKVAQLSRGKIDMTVGSALDIFGGNGVKYADCVNYNLAGRK